MSSNKSTLLDYDGDFTDWIELHNQGDSSINLLNYRISDKASELDKWSFPDIEIEANDYLVIFASSKNIHNQIELHTNFKIDQKGETLYLSNPNGQIVSQVATTFLHSDYSIGRAQDGSNKVATFHQPSPNKNNQLGKGIHYSHASGFYTGDILLELGTIGDNLTIRYTTNGSKPSNGSPVYTGDITLSDDYDHLSDISEIPTTPLSGNSYLDVYKWNEPINVNKSHVIRFAVFEEDALSSQIYTKNYFINSPSNYSFPVVSLAIDSLSLFDHDTGIYVPGSYFDQQGFNWIAEGNYHLRGEDWEREVNVTYFDQENSTIFSTDAGIRMRGYGSAAFPQKSFSLYFRPEYGLKKIDYPIFEQTEHTEYKRLVFRNSGQDFLYTHFQDALLQNILEPVDLELQLYQPSIVYINGAYWGIHNIREKYDEYYFKYNLGIKEEDINILDYCGGVEEGDNQEYLDILTYLEQYDLSIESNYQEIANKVDIENYIDFEIAEIYYANYDWPCNNYKIWKSNEPGSKWRFLIYDLDLSTGYGSYASYDKASLEHATTTGNEWPHCNCSNLLFIKLLTNEGFKQQFIDRFAYHLNNTFNSDRILEKIEAFKDQLSPEMDEHIDRWGYPSSTEFWEERIGVLKEFAVKRPCNMKGNIMNFFQLSSFDFDCSDNLGGELNPSKVTVAPNPTNGQFYISNNSAETLKGTITLRTSFGQLIYSEIAIEVGSFQRNYIDISTLNISSGTYLFHFENNHFSETTKLIINR